MAIPTTTEEQYKRLRSYLNPYLRGPNVDAVLTVLASANAAPLINNISAVNDQLYIATASGTYLDERLAQYGISRPPAVGLSDEVFRQIGIQVKNRKQVRDLINNLLDAMFGDEQTKASSPASLVEPYSLVDGDTLIINYDNGTNANIVFTTADFSNIGTATAQEVADAITVHLRNQGLSGTAISKNDGNGNYVELLSDTIGPASSVTVFGGSAQNQFQFDSIVPAGGNMSTQWTVSLQPGGVIRFTWTGGADPQLGKVNVGNYVNIYGGGFASSTNEGSYTITNAVGGAIGVAYFEVVNPLGTSGVVVQGLNNGHDDVVLFYNPVKRTITSNLSYAAIYQTQANLLQVFLPSATKVVKRERIGSSHLHYPPYVSYTLNAQPLSGDQFQIATGITLIAGGNFTIGATIDSTVTNMASALATTAGIDATANKNVLNVQQDDATLNMIGSYSGSQNIVPSGLQGDETSLAPNQQGPYMYDPTQTFTVGVTGTSLSQTLNATNSRVIQVADASQFPDAFGYIVLGYGTQGQEGPIPYISRPSNDTLLISPAYTIKGDFPAGTDVSIVAQKNPPIISQDGFDYPFYITDVVSGREYVQQLIQDVSATGINVVFTILYPNDIGLGKWGTIYTENPTIWGS